MKRGFYTIMAAQFFSSLADNALFVAGVELLKSWRQPEWQGAALVPMFAFFYVILAPFVGAIADSLPKGQVMFFSNLHQSTWLPDDAVRQPSLDCLRHRGLGRGGLLASQVRHPDRIAAQLLVGQGQRLDRGLDDRSPSSWACC
jgi:MFS family permease